MKHKLNELPKQVVVVTSMGRSGVYLAELPELDVFTEADSPEELESNITDLICAYYEVPQEMQGLIWYKPNEKLERTKKETNFFGFASMNLSSFSCAV